MIYKPLVLGTEVFSGDWGKDFSQDEAKKILFFAHDKNIEELDTANSYGNSNYVEKLIGSITKKNKLKFRISSKFKLNLKKNFKISEIVNNLEKQLDNSIRHLNVDRLETYYFHSGNNKEFFIDEVWRYLEKRKNLGDIKHLGLSLKHELVVRNDTKQVVNSKNYNISKIQTVLNIFSKESLNFVIPYCLKNKIDIYGRMPLAKGLLSGNYTSVSNFKKKDPRRNSIHTTKILNYRLNNSELNLTKIINWPLNYVKKIIFSVKNIKQLEEITNIKFKKKNI